MHFNLACRCRRVCVRGVFAVIVAAVAIPTLRGEDDAAVDIADTAAAIESTVYFPPPDSEGGWRTPTTTPETAAPRIDRDKLDEAFRFIQGETKNGGLLVVKDGWLVYERYFGKGHHEATANLASCGKSVTSISVGILLAERPELFPDGLDQKVFTPTYFPAEAFPLTDPRKKDIKLGQLLAMTAGIRGNNPVYVHREARTIKPIGPDGWPATVDAIAFGQKELTYEGQPASTKELWCDPGEGYSYSTSSIHLASVMLRHVTRQELQQYVDSHLAKPLGWERWGWGYKNPRLKHTPGGGGIVLRPTDMVRFGYLLLNEGLWGDRQLVPAEYVRLCGRKSPYNPHFPYSLQFDVNTDGDVPDLPRDAFWKTGSGGHALYVVPSLKLVVWKLGGRDGQYALGDTGMKVHPDAARDADPREGWKQTVDKSTAVHKTLAMVVEAVR